MKIIHGLLCALAIGCCGATLPGAVGGFVIDDEFIAYLKLATNPHEFGLKPDGRFYPYSTPRGRRIGYALPVPDKALYRFGWSKAEAEAHLRVAMAKAAEDVAQHVTQHYPGRPFARLSRKRQEMLVDCAFSEGAKTLSPEFYRAVLDENWDKLFNRFLYIRWVEKGWPDTTRNKAFADRWLAAELRLRP